MIYVYVIIQSQNQLIGKIKTYYANVPLSPETSTLQGYLWLYEAKLPRIKMYGIGIFS